MSLQDLGAIGELVGGIAIIVSLLYVGMQIKHGTNATRAATNQAFNSQYYELLLNITRIDNRDIWWRGLTGLKNLHGSENASFMALMGAISRTQEMFYLERIEGRFDSKMYDGYQLQFVDLFGHEGAREYWELRKHQFTDEFGSYLKNLIASVEAKPMYKSDSSDVSH